MKNGKVKPSCKIENQKKCENPWKSKGFVICHQINFNIVGFGACRQTVNLYGYLRFTNVGAAICRPFDFMRFHGRIISAPTLWCTVKL